MKKLLVLLVMILPLMGCIPAVAVLAGASAGGAVIYDKRSFKTMSQDHRARAYAQRWLSKDPVLKGHAHVSVTVFNQVALLVGQAQTPEMRARAYKIASQVPNIKRIYNEVTVNGPISSLQKTNDSWITTKVKSRMLAKRGLHSTNMKVITEDGIVYLMGAVVHQQASLAASVARRVAGVKKVVKVFEYEQ